MSEIPDLHSYDYIIVNSSAGKDSQAMLDYVVEKADAVSFPRDRMIVVHASLGKSEWLGTELLASAQAKHYGLRFVVVQREQNLLAHVEERRMWPSPKNRYCTSDHKRDQVAKLFTRLRLDAKILGQARFLSCMGMRAQESPARAKLVPLRTDPRTTNGRRHVDIWLPIHTWKVEDVWARIKQSGVPHHPAYDLGLPRLSCVFCIFAPTEALLLAGKHNRELLAEHVALEKKIGHTFKHGLSLASIQERLEDGEEPGPIQDWTM